MMRMPAILLISFLLLGAARSYAQQDLPQSSQARDRELVLNWKNGNYLGAAGLTLLKITLAYGIGSVYFLAFFWVALFTIAGPAVLWTSFAARYHGAIWCVGASLDHLLPVVELNK